MWINCFVISVIVWVAAVIAAIAIGRRTYKSKRIFTPTNTMLVGTFISSVFMFLPIYAQNFKDDALLAKIEETFLLSIHHTIRLFVIDCDFDVVRNALEGLNAGFSIAYSAFAAILYICAPLLTFGFLLSFFKNISSYKKYISSYNKDAYVFSEINEKSLALAKSIKENHNALIVFTDVFEKNDEESYELIEKARELGAICFKKDIVSVNFKLHSGKSKISFFAIGADESENVKQAIDITASYSQRKNTILYVFSTSVESELLLTSANKGVLKVHRVNDVRSLVYRILYENGKILFDGARQVSDDEKQISAVIIGTGRHGTEMLKALSWYCQMDGYKITIDAFDKDPLAESKFKALCPELMSTEHNGVYRDGDAKYLINVHSGFDVESYEFAQEIKKLTEATYVFVSLGSDEDNIKAAVMLRTLFEQMNIKPTIHAVVYNTKKKKNLKGVENFKKEAYEIDFIGDLKTMYSEEVIIDSELEAEALRIHLQWGKEEEFWSYEYNYLSSVASAMHRKIKEELKIYNADKYLDDLTEEEITALACLEHCRWNAYMRSTGYIYSGSTESNTRNDLGKMHHNLVLFDELSEKDKLKDINVTLKKRPVSKENKQ